MNAAVPLIADFDDVIVANFTLNAQVPGLHVGLADVGIDAIYSRPVTKKGLIGLRNDILVGRRTQRVRRWLPVAQLIISSIVSPCRRKWCPWLDRAQIEGLIKCIA